MHGGEFVDNGDRDESLEWVPDLKHDNPKMYGDGSSSGTSSPGPRVGRDADIQASKVWGSATALTQVSKTNADPFAWADNLLYSECAEASRNRYADLVMSENLEAKVKRNWW